MISELVDDESMQDDNHQTMDAFIQTINGFGLEEAQHHQELDTFLKEFLVCFELVQKRDAWLARSASNVHTWTTSHLRTCI